MPNQLPKKVRRRTRKAKRRSRADFGRWATVDLRTLDLCHTWGCLGGCGKWHLWDPFTRTAIGSRH
jgi:hypothetical protein